LLDELARNLEAERRGILATQVQQSPNQTILLFD
jgi:hypothetical protein